MTLKTFDRTSEGLRDALMSEMEDIRAGVATPAEAQAFAILAEKVIRSLEADLSAEKLEDERKHVEYETQDRIRKREAKQLRLSVEQSALQISRTEVVYDA